MCDLSISVSTNSVAIPYINSFKSGTTFIPQAEIYCPQDLVPSCSTAHNADPCVLHHTYMIYSISQQANGRKITKMQSINQCQMLAIIGQTHSINYKAWRPMLAVGYGYRYLLHLGLFDSTRYNDIFVINTVLFHHVLLYSRKIQCYRLLILIHDLLVSIYIM